MPEEWKRLVIKPIYKKGDVEKTENYRGITLLDKGYTIYAEWLRKKLEKELNEKEVLGRTQFAFKKETGTVEAIYVLTDRNNRT